MSQAQADAKLIAKAEKGNTAAMVLLGECYEKGAGVPLDSTIALQWFQKAADMGDGEAWLRISRYHLHSSLLPHDTARYVAIRQEWAEKGLPNALAAMYIIYEHGIGVKADSARAREYLQLALKKGSPWGYYEMGYVYADGLLGYGKDMKKALQHWQKAWKMKELDAGEPLVIYYKNMKDYKSAWKYINEGLKWSEPWAFAQAANFYYMGFGVDTDEKKAQEIITDAATKYNTNVIFAYAASMFLSCDDVALRDTLRALNYLKKGIAINDPYCMVDMAVYCANNGMEEDAIRYFTQAANQHSGTAAYACYEMARMTFQGMGCEADGEEAMRWLKRGADEYDDAHCASTLASFYEDEEYLNLNEAAKYYRKAIDLGDADALVNLGNLYVANANMDRAMECFQELVDKGNPDGYYWMAVATVEVKYLQTGIKKGSDKCADMLGSLYESGADYLGVKQDYKKAAQCYGKSHTAEAKFHLARYYFDGNIGKQSPKDIKKGMALLNAAADSGWIEAIYYLGACYESGDNVDSIDYDKALTYYSLLARNDVASGLFKVGYFYEFGLGGLPVDYALALEFYQSAADKGNRQAMYYLGDAYRTGVEGILDKDPQKAFELYSLSDSLGSAVGTYYVARSYMEGCGVAIDTAAAIPYLYEAAASGVGNAAYYLADFYNYARAGFPANGDSALYYYLSGHKNGSANASYFIGNMLLKEGNDEMAVKYLTTAAQRGHVDAIVMLAVCLQEGTGVEADPVEAYRLFKVALSYGPNAQAYASLGLATLQGNGCMEDESLGKRYLDTAVSMGHEKSEYYLALCHLNGWGCLKDTVEAVRHLERAADFGNIRAINALGDVYESKGDYKNAVLYYEKGVTLGSLESYCNLGYCYQEGNGVVLNSQKAFELYQVAAEYGYMRGYMLMAQSYLNGMYVEKSVPQAMEWLEKAAAAGNSTAMYYLGAFYAEGEEGVKPDPKKAKAWYKKAAAAGNTAAEAALQRL